MVRKVCFNITNEDEDVLNDLVQVVFIRAYYSLHQLRDASKFGEWVCAIARNEALKLQKYRLYRYCPWMRGMATSQISCNNGIDKKASHVPL